MKRIHYLLPALFLMVCAPAVRAQYAVARVSDFGELYSTYGVQDLKTELAGQFSTTKLAYIAENAQETAWPADIAQLDGRNTHRPRMYDYKMYKVATFKGDSYTLLLVPAAENSHMPPGMRPEHDIYFVVGSRVVTTEASKTFTESQATPDNSDGLAVDDNGDPLLRILDPTKIMAGYRLNEDQNARNLFVTQSSFSETDFEFLSKICREAEWPEGINDYYKRQGKSDQIKQYKVRFAANFIDDDGKNITIVQARMEENQHMPVDMQPTSENGLFMVFLSEGIEYIKSGNDDNGDDEFSYTYSIDEATDFDAQINFIVEASHNNFDDMLGKKIAKEEGGLSFGDDYESLIQLEGAERCYIAPKMLTKERTFIASFGEFTDKASAEEAYTELIEEVNEIYFECCDFVEGENTGDNLSINYWMPFDAYDVMDDSLTDVLIEVQLAKSFDIDDNFKMTDLWTVVLRVTNEPK